MSIRNLDWIRNLKPDNIGDLGARLYEALSDLDAQHQTLAQQANGNGESQPSAPPQIHGFKVTGQNGHFNVQITDRNQIYRGIQYYAEYSTSPHFTNPQTIHLGDSRNHNVFLGNGTYYWRGYSAYASSPPSQPVVHGGAIPIAVPGGGSVGSPLLQGSQGSGTGEPGVGGQGPGTIPFRTATGAAPVR